MTNTICHINVGYSRPVAAVLGIQPTTLVLCGAKDGDTIRDDRTALKVDPTPLAACDCGACKAIARIMHEYDLEPEAARRRYRKEGSTR
jgi:hypothetical protein